jgi:predicted nucleic acid-binding protein
MPSARARGRLAAESDARDASARAFHATGNLVPDAYIASVVLGYDCPVATFDRDFRRFDGPRIVTPAA